MEKRRTPVRTAMTAAVREAWAIFQRRYCRMESPAFFLPLCIVRTLRVWKIPLGLRHV